jgi:histidine triad (HIT) family protein
MSDVEQCVFCRIVAEDIPALRVFETDEVLAFLDVNPLADGHTLIVPKAHVVRLEEMSGEMLSRLTSVIPDIARAVIAATSATGYNVLQNNGRDAGQEVQHVHFHIIPRRPADGLGYRWQAGKYTGARATEVQNLIRNALG